MTEPEGIHEQVPIAINAQGTAYVEAGWLTGRIRDWAEGFDNTPGPMLQRLSAGEIVHHVAIYLRREADALDVALIQYATENPRIEEDPAP